MMCFFSLAPEMLWNTRVFQTARIRHRKGKKARTRQKKDYLQLVLGEEVHLPNMYDCGIIKKGLRVDSRGGVWGIKSVENRVVTLQLRSETDGKGLGSARKGGEEARCK